MQLGEYAEGDTVVLEDDSEYASADALDGEEASSGGVRLANVIRELRDRSNISLLLYDSESDQTLVSSARDVEVMRNRVRRYIVGHAGAKRDVLREYDNYMIQKTFDPLSKTFYLESWGFFSDNATIFIMTMPMESIHESAAISNRFLMFVGIVVILAGSILIYFIIPAHYDADQTAVRSCRKRSRTWILMPAMRQAAARRRKLIRLETA